MSLAEEYKDLATSRDQFLRAAYDAASLTVPTLIRPDVNSTIEDPYQSTGAEGVTNLASKLLLALFPPGRPFFRFIPDARLVDQATQQDGPQVKTRLEENLAAVERRLRSFIESSGYRPTLYSLLQHLVVTGSPLLHIDQTGRSRVYPLDRHVVRRDGLGRAVRIITEESVDKSALAGRVEGLDRHSGRSIKVYTGLGPGPDAELNEDGFPVKFDVVQETEDGFEILGTRGTVPTDAPSHIPLRLFQVPGEDYGRGLVELHLGDLAALEGLTQALVEGAIAASRVIWCAKPGFGGNIRDLSEAPNGSIRIADADQIKAMQLDKMTDFSTVRAQIQDLKTDLRAAFLMNRSIQRNAERVTAAEIRYMAQELEAGLGGAYSFLAEELQLPLVRRFSALAARKNALPDLDPDQIKPAVVTGVEGLGRGADFEDQRLFAETLLQTIGPQETAMVLRTRDYAGSIAASLGLDSSRLVKSEQELTDAYNRQSLQALTEKLGPNAVTAIGQQLTPNS
jgi:Autographiviridae portal protein